MTTVEQVFAELEEDVEWSLDEFQERRKLAGRNHGPALLAEAYDHSIIERSTLAATIGDIWSMAEFPDRALEYDTWRWLFGEAGYTADGVPVERPGAALVLYRGSVDERRSCWSWTDSLDVGMRYADGEHYRRPQGAVWVASVPPENLFARNTGRGEFEYVVDTDGLDIQRLSGLH